jgi:hypothetical protein
VVLVDWADGEDDIGGEGYGSYDCASRGRTVRCYFLVGEIRGRPRNGCCHHRPSATVFNLVPEFAQELQLGLLRHRNRRRHEVLLVGDKLEGRVELVAREPLFHNISHSQIGKHIFWLVHIFYQVSIVGDVRLGDSNRIRDEFL